MAESTHDFKDFDFRWTRDRHLDLALTVQRIVAGVASAEDISEGTVWVTGKRSLADPDSAAVFRLNSGDLGGVTKTSPAAGQAVAAITPAMTASLPDRATLVFVDCVWVDADGKAYSFQKGQITFYGSAEETLS